MRALAHWCVRHHKLVIGGWIALLIVLAGVVAGLGSDFSNSTRLPASDSATAYALLAKGGSDAASEATGTIVWHSAGSAVSASTKSDIGPMLAKVAKVPGVTAVVSPFTSAGRSQVSTSTNTAYATVVFYSTAHEAEAAQLAKNATSREVTVQVGGTAFTPIKPSPITEVVGVLAALAVLLLVFRSGWAAAMPIVTGVAGVGVSSVAIMLLSHVVTVPTVAPEMSALIGLGVGIDYALFIVARHRDGLSNGANVATSIATAMATSGHAVLYAGGTVMIALLGMVVLDVGFLTGMAFSAALTVALTVLAAETLLPALLAGLGVRVLGPSERSGAAPGPGVVSLGPVASPPRVWARWSHVVARHPVPSAALAMVILVTLAMPALSLRLGSADASSDPAGTSTHSYYLTMSRAFGAGFDSKLLLVAETPDAKARADWGRLVAELPQVADVASVSAASPITVGTLSMAQVQPATTSQAQATNNLVNYLRSDVVRDSEAGSDLQVHVGGTTATSIDFAHALTSKLPIFLAIIGGLGFLLLALAFRSLLVPLIGAVSNLLSIAVALGATVALFQWGWGPSLFGIGGPAPLEYIVAMLVVGVMFGLSMDYHVFLVSRMKEEWAETADNHRSVTTGAAQTGRVITTAACIMACVFTSFGLAGVRTISEFGVGLAVAVLADALLLRMTVVPALMHRFGPRAWALPRSLDRVLPHLSLEGLQPEDGTEGLALPEGPSLVPVGATAGQG
jgi:RND superfamily putative drug exporter